MLSPLTRSATGPFVAPPRLALTRRGFLFLRRHNTASPHQADAASPRMMLVWIGNADLTRQKTALSDRRLHPSMLQWTFGST